MVNRQTIHERHGPPLNSEALIALWNAALVDRLLGIVWDAYDDLHEELLSKLPWTESYADLERSLSQSFARAINRRNDLLPVDVQHGPFEEESRSTTKPNAQPPQYDIAFVWNDNCRIMWPLEAKVLKSDKNTGANLGDYVETVQKRFLTGYYAPFSNGGAMLGYLQSGAVDTVIEGIAARLGCSLTPHLPFPDRCHKTSNHQRTIPSGKDYPVTFRLHHLILPLR